MSNPYNEQLCNIAQIIRGGEDGQWGDFEIGIPVTEIATLDSDLGITSDEDLYALLSTLECNDSLSEYDEIVLLSSFVYLCRVISNLGIDVSDALWQKYYINFSTYAIPFGFSSQEIHRHAILGGTYREGIFEEISKGRRSNITMQELREKAYKDAPKWIKEEEYPVGMDNIGVIQLVFKDWLLNLGKEHTPSELKEKLIGEVNELRKTKRMVYISKQTRWERAYEACDVMIYVLHIFSVYGLNIGEYLNSDK